MTGLSRLSRRERNIAAVTLGLALVTGLYVYCGEPVALRWLDLHRQVVAAEEELAQLRNLTEHKDRIEREYRKLQGAVTTGRTEQELKVTLLSEIDGLARGCGLEVSSVKPTSVRKEGLFERYGIELQVHCAGHQFAKLLAGLQSPEHLMRTDQVTISVGPGEPPMTVTLRISKLARLEGGGNG